MRAAVNELVEEQKHDAKWVADFSQAADDYLAADRRWWQVMDECAGVETMLTPRSC